MDDGEGPLHSVGSHFGQRVGQHRVPVSISPVDRQRDAVPVELRPQRGDQVADLSIDRADAAEMVVVLGDLQKSLAGDVSAPRDVFQERQHIFAALGPAKTDDENRIVRQSTSTFSRSTEASGRPAGLVSMMSVRPVLRITRPDRAGLPCRLGYRGAGWCGGSGRAWRAGHIRRCGRGRARRAAPGGGEEACVPEPAPST